MTSPLSKVINLALLSAVYELLEEDLREKAVAKEREEAARWEQRKQAVIDSIARTVYANHGHLFISNLSKARTAAYLREAAIEYSRQRCDHLMRQVEECAARFERNGTC